ncbi:unnamed protein product [Thlaspi arvense]|uniref:Uncharacterized protein n=1 Tax=Thlaspi arvense TaxID=13288 RepID=A0AAU9RK23_THLAR|nr:unnamed protein product [Thlaspi arvense]
MEDYSHISEASGSRSFLYGTPALSASAASVTVYGSRGSSGSNPTQMPVSGFINLQASECYSGSPMVKAEGGTLSSHHVQRFHQYHQEGNEEGWSDVEAIKAKIMAHPHYSNLLEAYMDCQKVGAPPEVVARLTAVRQEFEARQRGSMASRDASTSRDPELDQFMCKSPSVATEPENSNLQEAYYDMLVKYREELTRPLQEATEFMRRVETQLNTLNNGPVSIFPSGNYYFLSSHYGCRRERHRVSRHTLQFYPSWIMRLEEFSSGHKQC